MLVPFILDTQTYAAFRTLSYYHSFPFHLVHFVHATVTPEHEEEAVEEVVEEDLAVVVIAAAAVAAVVCFDS